MKNKTGSGYTERARGKKVVEKVGHGPVEFNIDKVQSSEEKIL